jgi:hypothetical protein
MASSKFKPYLPIPDTAMYCHSTYSNPSFKSCLVLYLSSSLHSHSHAAGTKTDAFAGCFCRSNGKPANVPRAWSLYQVPKPYLTLVVYAKYCNYLGRSLSGLAPQRESAEWRFQPTEDGTGANIGGASPGGGGCNPKIESRRKERKIGSQSHRTFSAKNTPLTTTTTGFDRRWLL